MRSCIGRIAGLTSWMGSRKKLGSRNLLSTYYANSQHSITLGQNKEYNVINRYWTHFRSSLYPTWLVMSGHYSFHSCQHFANWESFSFQWKQSYRMPVNKLPPSWQETKLPESSLAAARHNEEASGIRYMSLKSLYCLSANENQDVYPISSGCNIVQHHYRLSLHVTIDPNARQFLHALIAN